MRIGIDIDGVLTDVERFELDYFSKYLVKNNIEYTVGASGYSIGETFNVSKQTEVSFWNEHIFFYAEKEKIRPFASEVIKKLKSDGHEIYIITARELTEKDDELGIKMQKTVKEWLSNNDVIYDQLIFSQKKEKNEKKVDACLENKIEIMIEDSPTNINELSKMLPVICYDTSYNRHCFSENIYRCFSWYDIYKKINEISNN